MRLYGHCAAIGSSYLRALKSLIKRLPARGLAWPRAGYSRKLILNSLTTVLVNRLRRPPGTMTCHVREHLPPGALERQLNVHAHVHQCKYLQCVMALYMALYNVMTYYYDIVIIVQCHVYGTCIDRHVNTKLLVMSFAHVQPASQLASFTASTSCRTPVGLTQTCVNQLNLTWTPPPILSFLAL